MYHNVHLEINLLPRGKNVDPMILCDTDTLESAVSPCMLLLYL